MSTLKTKPKRVGRDLTQGSILKSLLLFALPMVLTSLIQQLYSTVDLIIIGQFVGSVGTVGVSTGGEISDLMTPIANAFAMAGQVYIAQLAGAKDHGRIKTATGTLLTMMMAMSAFAVVIVFSLNQVLLNWLNCPPEAMAQARSYLLITTAGMPFVFGYNAICGILRGMGESQRPLIFVAVAATVNIFADLLLVAVFHLEAAGTAIATVASQIGAFAAAFLFMWKRRESFGFSLSRDYLRIDRPSMKVILKMGVPQLIRSLSVNGSMLWVKSSINFYGLVPSATYSVGNKIEKLMQVFVQGVDGAAGAMIGQNIGARKHDRVVKTLWTTLACTICLGMMTATLFYTVPKPLYRLFTTDEAVIEYGVTFLRIMVVACIVTSFTGTFKAISTGAGAALLCFVIGVLDGVCRIVICLIAVHLFHQGAQGYFWGAALCQLIPGLICFIYFLSGKWRTKKLLSES